MRYAMHAVGGESHGVRRAEVSEELVGQAARAREPERVAAEPVLRREMDRELSHERVDDKPRITRRHLPHGRRILLLVTAHRPHGRQAARDCVHAIRNAPAERQLGKGSHGRY
jgi:hypothetical protein